jgi:hypothetical protein
VVRAVGGQDALQLARQRGDSVIPATPIQKNPDRSLRAAAASHVLESSRWVESRQQEGECMAAPQLPRDFPDHAIREALLQPRNLCAVLREAAAETADRLDYTRLEVVKRMASVSRGLVLSLEGCYTGDRFHCLSLENSA